jgi:hypothetical protein
MSCRPIESSSDDGLGMELSDGEFNATWVLFQTEGNLTDTDVDGDLIEPDPVDAVDADTFEVLTQGIVYSVATIPNQSAVNETTEVSEAPTVQTMAQTIPFNVSNEETSLMVIIDHFLLGSVGAPIPSVPQGPLAHVSDQATAVELAWAPFTSECDWKITHWAKTHGPMLSAVTDLLIIDKVCMLSRLIVLSLTRC